MKILLRQVRNEKGISLRSLSQKSSISFQQLSKIENQNVDIKLSTLCKIARALKVDPRELFDCEEKWWR